MRALPRWSVVVPTNRPEQFEKFVAAWEPLFAAHDAYLFPVFDTEDTWEEMPAWMPRRTDMIRSLGFKHAWDAQSTYTLTLDDDVRPLQGVDIFAEYEAAFERGAYCSEYFSVGDLTTDGGALRGFPYRERRRADVAVQYGGWHGVLDWDAATQLVRAPYPGHAFAPVCIPVPKGVPATQLVRAPHPGHAFAPVCIPVPKGVPATTCIMNAAFRTEYTPLMWQLPMVDGKYNRFGDIWSGLLQKKILDAFGKVMLINGAASVYHERASDPVANLERETPGVRINETLWQHLGVFDYTPEIGDRMGDSYRLLIDIFANHPDIDDEYANTLRYASCKWLEWFAW